MWVLPMVWPTAEVDLWDSSAWDIFCSDSWGTSSRDLDLQSDIRIDQICADGTFRSLFGANSGLLYELIQVNTQDIQLQKPCA